uniref:O-acyltransferase WSD1 C-terminal domain-containing protein n=1 Tax=viral metagenome TaxID=1070528 RepID=A0A6C0CRQ7_9ZZZZ
MEEMDLHDKLFYKMEECNSIFSNTIVLRIEIDGVLNTKVCKEKIRELIINYPKLSMIVENMLWKKVDVDINNHLIEINRDKESIKNIINEIINKSFIECIPKWIVYNINCSDDNKSLIIMKMHHSYGDGDKCTEMLSSIGDVEKEPIKAGSSNNVKEGYLMRICKSIYYFIVSFCMLVHFILFFKKEKIFAEPHTESEAVYCNIYNFNLDKLKLKKTELGITMNDLLYGIILKSIRKYANKEVHLSSCSIINLRKIKTSTEANNFSLIVFSTPVDNRNTFDKIHHQMNCYKNSPIVLFMNKVLNCIAYFSCDLLSKFLTYIFEKNNFGYSCYNTKIKTFKIAGKKVKSIGNIIIPYKQDVFFSLLTYGDNIQLNICYRKGILDEKIFKECVSDVYNEL